MNDFQFGGVKPATAFDCCAKPRGCMNENSGCGFLRHPWKRAVLFNDPDAPCPKQWRANPEATVQTSCALKNGHQGACVPKQ